ncbi:hypothetical protein JOM56_014780 [Amanita muscaria]
MRQDTIEDDELDRLLGPHVSKDAVRNPFYSPPECHPNTRTTVRNEVGEWLEENGSEKSPLLWLHGPAGVGKSTIARTIAASYNQIAATFSLPTSSDRSASTLFATLTWQLARNIPEARMHIIASLKNSGSLLTSEFEEQFDLLIVQPLRKSTTTLKSRPVIVIDGLDECIDESMRARFLRVLVRAGEDGRMPVRFIICSRPEPWIRAILGKAHDVNPTANGQELRLPSLLRSDIARYLTDTFNAIPYPGDGTNPWFTASDISDLVEASCGQFLYASTLVRLLDEPHFDPRDVFEMARRHGGSLPTPDLNELYKAILKRAQDTIRNEAQKSGPDYETGLRFLTDSLTILVFLAGNVHFFTVPKSFLVMESLLGLESGQLTKKLGKMHSVLRIVPGESVQVHHRSFLEFLQNRERSGEYYISYSSALRRILILMGRAGVRYSIFQ